MKLASIPITMAITLLAASVHANDDNKSTAFKLPVTLVTPNATPISKNDLVNNSFLKRQKETRPAMNSISLEKEIQAIDDYDGIANERAFKTNHTINRKASFNFIDSIKAKYKPQQQLGELNPGANIAIPVAAGITNPIITNFNMVAVRTHDEEAIIELEDGRVYLTLNSMKPVGLMIFEEGVPESMINITLIPMNAMPVVVNLQVKQSDKMLAKGQQYRADIEKRKAMENVIASQPKHKKETDHISHIKDILKPVGNGKLPRGFTLSLDTSDAMKIPCSITIEQRVMQRIVGLREIIDVVRVKNNHQQAYAVREQACESKDTIAVAIYNKSLLQPGEATEIYILRDKLASKRNIDNQTRPRVIN